jgi:hypothetical protein
MALLAIMARMRPTMPPRRPPTAGDDQHHERVDV